MPIKIDLDHPIFALKDKVREASSCLLETFGFNYFQYLRCYADGSINCLTNNTGLFEYAKEYHDQPIVFSSFKEIETQLLRDWSQSEHGEIEIINFVPTSQDTLWTAAICNAHVTIDGTKHTFEHLRETLIAEKEDGIWKIAHTHCSFPDYRNAESGSFPVNG